MNYIISLLIFGAVLALVEGAYLLWAAMNPPGSSRLHKRLRLLSAGGEHGREVLELLRRQEPGSTSWLNEKLTKIPRFHVLDRLIERAGLKVSVAGFTGIQIGLSILILFLAELVLHTTLLLAVPISFAVGFFLPWAYVKAKGASRVRRFDEQLPDAMDFMARSLRAGNPFLATLKAASEEMPDPIGTEFGFTFDEVNYGLELEDALANLGERVGSEELRYFITAVLVQKATGGNLAAILNRIAHVMRERSRTYGEIRIQASEMKTSARVLIGLPFFVGGVIALFNPTYLNVLVDNKLGQGIILMQGVFMLAGYLVIRHMINFRV